MDGLTPLQAAVLFAVFMFAIGVASVLDKRADQRANEVLPMRRLVARLKRRLMPPSEIVDGYEHPELVDVVFRKTMAYDPQGDWPEMAGVSTVLDFGGGCGRHYKEARSSNVHWAVVESQAMVERAKEIATDKLQFFTDISAAKNWLGEVDVMHSNGALQYAPDPQQAVRQLCELNAKKMLWQRVFLSPDEVTRREVQSSFLGDNGPGFMNVKEKTMRYEHTRIPERAFLEAHAGYKLVDRGPDWFTFYGPSCSS
jgi:hypothetical protein